jgi:tetratricopeptide (TPR) repeat protein
MNRQQRRDAERRLKHADPAARAGISGVDRALEAFRAGRYADAERAMERVLAAQPDDPSALHFTGVIAHKLSKVPLALERLHRALALAPNYPEAHNDLGLVLLENKRLEEAAERFRAAIELWPDFVNAIAHLGEALHKLGRFEEALPAHRRAIALDSYHRMARVRLAASLLALGRPAEALAAAQALLAFEPTCQYGWAYRGHALQALGRLAEARFTHDLARFATAHRLGTPPGFASEEAFRAALAAELRAHPTLIWEPHTAVTYGGRVTTDMMVAPGRAVRGYAEALRQAIARYVATLAPDPRHPFLGRIPRRYSLKMIGTVMEAGGRHPEHIHADAWLSGCYYLEVPPQVRADDPGQAGWLECGVPDYPLPAGFVPERQAFYPEPGLALFFPSYVYHATLPYEGEGERLGVAFDVYPEA